MNQETKHQKIYFRPEDRKSQTRREKICQSHVWQKGRGIRKGSG